MKSGFITTVSTHELGGVGDNTPLLETEMSTHGDTERENQLGTAGRIDSKNLDDGLDLADIIARFQANTRASMKSTTQEEYVYIFKKLLQRSELLATDGKLTKGLTRRAFSGRQGRTLVLNFFQTVKEESWDFHKSGLKAFWAEGLEVDWPVRPRDIRQQRVYQARWTPRKEAVYAWKNAIDCVKDPWLKLMLLLFWQYGWRPSHLVAMRWRNVERDSDGNPYAIFACEEGFKRQSPVRAILFPDVRNALCEWEKVSPNVTPNAPILCWKSAGGELAGSRVASVELLRDAWYRFARNHDLPRLQPNAARHFVSTAARKAGLSEPATNLLQGHKIKSGTSSRGHYDHEVVLDLLDEQIQVVPNGPLGWFCGTRIESSGLPREATEAVAEFMEGKTTVMDFANRMERIRMLSAQKAAEQPKIESGL